jgi:hypothetical protein
VDVACDVASGNFASSLQDHAHTLQVLARYPAVFTAAVVAMAATSCKPCCQPKELAGQSLVGLLLEVQEYAKVNEKSLKWAVNLECLFVPTEPQEGNAMILKSIPEKDINESQNYVAVSYSCDHMPDYESDDSGGYDIKQHTSDQSPKPNKTRRLVIQRALRYANQVESPSIWVDQDCVDQEDPIKKRDAMDSMDLVYSRSEFPVGLMATVLNTEEEISALQSLLDGELASEEDFAILDDHQMIVQTMELLERFSKDRFWGRAWIYQEEYVAGTSMNILIRHKPELEQVKREKFKVLDKNRNEVQNVHIEEEVCFSAAEFRKKATIFLLALQEGPFQALQEKSKTLLGFFDRYNVLYRHTAYAYRKAMSSKVIADIHKRGIGKKYDRFPIVANSCDYATRFHAEEMTGSPYSVNLCILAMFILNGEIIDNDREHMALPTEMSLSEYLDNISFDSFDPPVAARELSWLKSCRLPHPKLVPSGIRTEGYLWRVKRVITTRHWRHSSLSRQRKTSTYGLSDEQRACLFKLFGVLKKGSKLRKELHSYLAEDLKLQRAPARTSKRVAKRYKDLMANEVCNAIENGEPLYLATIDGTDAEKAIFVGLGSCETIFTAWSHGEEKDGRIRTRHLSLSVRIEDRVGRQWMPRVRIRDWVNGLVFFTKTEKRNPKTGKRRTKTEQKRVIMSWPEVWLRTNPKLNGCRDVEVVS